MDTPVLTSTKPYLVRALYDWINDNNCTPHIVVNAEADNVEIPKQYVEDGRITLNISPEAVRNLQITNDFLEFSARFNGVTTQLYTPIAAILAIYAKENGHGMVFGEEHIQNTYAPKEIKMSVKRPDPNKKPSFKVIK